MFLQLPQSLAGLWRFDQWRWDEDRATIVNIATDQPVAANYIALTVVPH